MQRSGKFAETVAEPLHERYWRTSFEIMGCIAKLDGRVTEREIAVARAFMREAALAPEGVEAAIDAFTRGKQISYDWSHAVMALRRACATQPALLGEFLDLQLRAAIEGSGLQGPVRRRLLRIAVILGVNETRFRRREAEWRQHLRDRGQRERLSIDEACRVLGVATSASPVELERAYRRQLSRHHPDKLKANGLPDSELAQAQVQTRRIIEAWDVIREQRGIGS